MFLLKFLKRKRKWNFSNGLVAVNIVVALITTFVSTVLTIIVLINRLD